MQTASPGRCFLPDPWFATREAVRPRSMRSPRSRAVTTEIRFSNADEVRLNISFVVSNFVTRICTAIGVRSNQTQQRFVEFIGALKDLSVGNLTGRIDDLAAEYAPKHGVVLEAILCEEWQNFVAKCGKQRLLVTNRPAIAHKVGVS